MKKTSILLLAIIMSFTFTVQAGYVIRGIWNYGKPANLKNYTLTVDNNGPVSAASMHSYSGVGYGKNSIVIIPAIPPFYEVYFLVPSEYDEVFNIEVRDFHYIPYNNTYVLCGSRESASDSCAFIAIIDGNLTTMWYNEYPKADMFYSILGVPLSSWNFYVCGKSGNQGVIASVNSFTLQLTNFYTTDTEWEYHKIIAKYNSNPATQGIPDLVASGRNPQCTQIGFTVLNLPFNTINCYIWEQATDPLSHCVVSDDILMDNTVVLASSNLNIVTLNPVTYPIPSTVRIRAYSFNLPGDYRYCVQDIGTSGGFGNSFRTSVAGFKRDITAQSIAWHGNVIGLGSTRSMTNNDYNGPSIGDYEHYKIRYNQQGDEFTGGDYQSQNSTQFCALFGAPLTTAEDCHYPYISSLPVISSLIWSSFGLTTNTLSERDVDTLTAQLPILPVYDECYPFRNGESVPELIISAKDESEIINYYDRIIVKDIPMNTNYHIYNIIGQLVQTGTTNPDISTTNLNKGIYILRLENGKAFKFVK